MPTASNQEALYIEHLPPAVILRVLFFCTQPVHFLRHSSFVQQYCQLMTQVLQPGFQFFVSVSFRNFPQVPLERERHCQWNITFPVGVMRIPVALIALEVGRKNRNMRRRYRSHLWFFLQLFPNDFPFTIQGNFIDYEYDKDQQGENGESCLNDPSASHSATNDHTGVPESMEPHGGK